MADTAVIRDISDTIKFLLRENITELDQEDAIIFDSPGEIEESTATRLSAFLYHITESPHHRNTQPSFSDLSVKQFPPLVLDLYFIFVPYAQNREKEFIVMEKLMKTFNDRAALGGDVLQGNLSETGNDEIRIEPFNMSLDDMNKLWSTFPNKAFKLSKSYIITPVRIPSDVSEAVSRIAEKVITTSIKG
jgi:hypothetical protein